MDTLHMGWLGRPTQQTLFAPPTQSQGPRPVAVVPSAHCVQRTPRMRKPGIRIPWLQSWEPALVGHRGTTSTGWTASQRCRAIISESTEYEDRPDRDLGPSTRLEHKEPPKRHAVLHDFCMVIPYGALMLVAGLVSLAFKSGSMGLVIAGVGLAQLLLAVQSLGSWRKGKASTSWTAIAAAGSTLLTSLFWSNWRQGVARVPNAFLLVPSLSLTTFLIYNIAAGGNPPKKAEA